MLHYYKKLKNVTNSKTYVSFIASKQENIAITTEKKLTKKKKCPLNIKVLSKDE